MTNCSGAITDLRALGITAHGITCDLRDRDQIRAMVAETADYFDGLDIVVNNAGIIRSCPHVLGGAVDDPRIVDDDVEPVEVVGSLRDHGADLVAVAQVAGDPVGGDAQSAQVGDGPPQFVTVAAHTATRQPRTPSSRASSRPRPREPPVMSATRSRSG